MKNISKIVSVICAIALIATLSVGTVSAKSATPAKTKLVFYGIQDVNTADLFTKFEAQNNVTVQKIVQPSDKFDQSFMVAINGGQQVDFGMLNGQSVRSYITKGLIADLTKDVNYADRFYKSSADMFVINGKRYALPAITIWNMGLFYNKDIFAKYNLKAPKTYADVLNINTVLNKNGIAGISVGAANGYDLTNWYFVNFFQASGNKGLERTIDTLKGKAKFTDADYVEAMGYVQKYAKDNIFQKGFLGADGAARLATFASGKAGMLFTGNWDIAAMNTAGLKSSQIGVVNWPIMKNGAKAQVSGTAAGAAAVIYTKSASKNKALDLKALDYLTSDANNIKYNGISKTFLSTNKNVKIPGIDPLNQQIQNDLVPNIVTFLDWYWPADVTKVFAEELQSVMALQDSPKVAMDKIQKAFDAAVAKGYNYDAVK